MAINLLRADPSKPGIICNGPRLGGLGRSQGVVQSSAIALLAGLRVGFIDADRVTGATFALVDPTPHAVLKFTDHADFAGRVQQTFSGFDLIFVDFGATQLTNSATLLQTLGIMQVLGGMQNVAFVLNQIPHKPGLAVELERFGTFFASRAQIRVARHDINGTGKFEDLPQSLAKFPVHYVDNFPPHLDDLWRSRRLMPSDLIVAPPPDYEIATAKVASHLLRIAESSSFANWLGADAAIPKLRAAATNVLQYTPPLPADQLTNAVLMAYNGLQRALHEVLHAYADADCIKSTREAQHYAREYRAAKA